MQIERSKFSAIVLSLLGNRSRGLRLGEGGVVIVGPRQRHLGFAEIAAPAEAKKGFPFFSISLSITDGSKVRVFGVNPTQAGAFVTALNTRWRGAIRAQVASFAAEIDALLQVVERLEQPRRYPAACLLEPFRSRTEALFASIPWPLPKQTLPEDHSRGLDALAAFRRDPIGIRERAIEKFIEGELRDMSGFFDRIESNPLTLEQRTAVVTDEDATLVLAGAGSGKTSVITAKAAYLIESGTRQPEEILLMAFGKNAADEMAERIKERYGASVETKTFHALAYGIIREVEGQAPALAIHATDDAAFFKLIRDIIVDLFLSRDSPCGPLPHG